MTDDEILAKVGVLEGAVAELRERVHALAALVQSYKERLAEAEANEGRLAAKYN